MTKTGEGPTPAEGRIVDPVGEAKTSLKLSLAQAEAYIARMGPSAATRLLKLTVESQARTVDSWSARPPTDDQLQLTRKRIAQVLAMAKGR
jgi:hypothetical protein